MKSKALITNNQVIKAIMTKISSNFKMKKELCFIIKSFYTDKINNLVKQLIEKLTFEAN